MRIVLIIIATILSLISLLFIAISIEGLIQYSGQHMSNEARGFQSFFTALAFVFTVLAVLLWIYIFNKRKKQLPQDQGAV
ncbi:hypothetical protein [Hymenobacter sp. 102]|uniref:hypothetical protein n=1 Tax=Hymenobacter sp. 102 TaxID=3403152 RepID=UPI003CEFD328